MTRRFSTVGGGLGKPHQVTQARLTSQGWHMGESRALRARRGLRPPGRRAFDPPSTSRSPLYGGREHIS